MGPIAKEVAAGYAEKSIKFVVFDFTSDETAQAAQTAAADLGVAGTFAQNAPKTGFALLYDTKTQTVVGKFSAQDAPAKWRETIDKAFGG